jgi:Flp pilus assembly protein TadG
MPAALYADKRRGKNRSGQTALEYILVFIALSAAVFAAVYFLRAPGKIAVHTTDVICSERL